MEHDRRLAHVGPIGRFDLQFDSMSQGFEFELRYSRNILIRYSSLKDMILSEYHGFYIYKISVILVNIRDQSRLAPYTTQVMPIVAQLREPQFCLAKSTFLLVERENSPPTFLEREVDFLLRGQKSYRKLWVLRVLQRTIEQKESCC